MEKLPITPPRLFLPEVLAAQTPSVSLITSAFLFAFYYKTHYTNQLAVMLPAFVFGGEDYRYPWICVQLPQTRISTSLYWAPHKHRQVTQVKMPALGSVQAGL